jgi:hypothetical protein
MALPGIGTFLGGLGALFGKGSTYIQTRVEKLKNEKKSLEKERDEIEKISLDVNKPQDRKKASRLDIIIKRIDVINGLLENKAQD